MKKKKEVKNKKLTLHVISLVIPLTKFNIFHRLI